jgi:hypothetical protein
MNNLSSLFAISPENIAQAKSWALKAVEMAEKAKDEANGRGKRGEKIEECENVLAAALFNLGMLNEVRSLFFRLLAVRGTLMAWQRRGKAILNRLENTSRKRSLSQRMPA